MSQVKKNSLALSRECQCELPSLALCNSYGTGPTDFYLLAMFYDFVGSYVCHKCGCCLFIEQEEAEQRSGQGLPHVQGANIIRRCIILRKDDIEWTHVWDNNLHEKFVKDYRQAIVTSSVGATFSHVQRLNTETGLMIVSEPLKNEEGKIVEFQSYADYGSPPLKVTFVEEEIADY